MTLDFQQIRAQIIEMGKNAPLRERQLRELRKNARQLLEMYAQDLERLRQKVDQVVRLYEPSLRSAIPVSEALNARFPLPPLPGQATILAADGSQIFPDRHTEVEYGLINIGVIQMCYGQSTTPIARVTSKLFYDEDLYTTTGVVSDSLLALRRDLNERTILAELASQTAPPIITFTDGLMEIWGPREMGSEEASEFQKSLDEYLQVLSDMHEIKAITAGYVDKPSSRLVVRLLEVAMTPETELSEIKQYHPFRRIYDVDLYAPLLDSGERSPVFAVQSPSSKVYTNDLALHFFYINVGRPDHSWIVRVEIPAWVAGDPKMLSDLHAVLVHQCQAMGSRPYPYVLHRAHETALVSFQEKEQITRMIATELRQQGVPVGERSNKQSAKDLPGTTRYKR